MSYPIIDQIFGLYEQYGHESYGENLSQLEHMAQSAELAEAEGQSEEVILAAFLHDIGHLYGPTVDSRQMAEKYGVEHHEDLGADFLREHGFSETIATLVHGHVAAKRYLTWKYPDYYEKLSLASKTTLAEQGGPMADTEGPAFELHPLFALCLRMRHWDDEAKIPGKPLPDLNRYRAMMERHLGG